MIRIIEEYDNYVLKLPDLINKSFYKAEYFITNLGLKNATYYRKLREKNFTTQEVRKITELLFPEEILMRDLERSEADIKAGKVSDHSEVMARLRAKYIV